MGVSWRGFCYGLASKVSIVCHRRGQCIRFSKRGAVKIFIELFKTALSKVDPTKQVALVDPIKFFVCIENKYRDQG